MQFVPQSSVVRSKRATLDKASDSDYRRLLEFEQRQEGLIVSAFNEFVTACRSDDIVGRFRDMYSSGRAVQALGVTDGLIDDFASILETVFVNAGDYETKWLRGALNVKQVTKIDVSPDIDLSFDPGNADAAREMRKALLDMIQQITEAQRKAIRSVLAQALEEGLSPVEAARRFKSQIGLTANQMSAVNRYRGLLQSGSSEALERTLRDRRFDSTVSRAIDRGVQLSAQQINRMVDRYQDRMLAMRAETIARTEMLSTVNAARHQATIQMAGKVDLEMGRIQRTWRCVQDLRTRDTHRVMNKQVRGVEEAFVSPSGARLMFPGDRSAPAAEVINCRCTVLTKILPPQESIAIQRPSVVPVAPPPVYQNLKTGYQDTFSDGMITFENNDLARTAFSQMNSQIGQVLRNIEAAQLAEADRVLAAALKSAEALEVAAAKQAKKYTAVVRDAARARGLDATAKEVVKAKKFEYGVPTQAQKAPVGSGKDKTLFVRVDKNDELRQLSKEMYDESLSSKLTADQIAAIESYTSGYAFVPINKTSVDKRLRYGEAAFVGNTENLRNADRLISQLDDVFAKTSLADDIVVYRGMGADRWKRTFAGLREGQTVIIDRGFLSSSMSRSFANTWYKSGPKFVLEILLPKRAKALSVETVSRNKKEFEVLINRNAKFVVRELTPNSAVLELIV